MSCTHMIELKIKDRNGNQIKTECGHCLNCLIKKQAYLEFIAKRELLEYYRKGQGAAFQTLTYTDDYLPIVVPKNQIKEKCSFEKVYTKIKNGDLTETKELKSHGMIRPKDIKMQNDLETLFTYGNQTVWRKDLQNFLKRFRRNAEYHGYKNKFKTIYALEYGGETNRPHAHIIYLGLTQEEAQCFALKNWNYGKVDTGCLSNGGLRYVIDYVAKTQYIKEYKELFNQKGVQMPSIYHSINMGKEWILKHEKELIKENFKIPMGKNAEPILLPKKVIKEIAIRNGLNLKYIWKKIFEDIENENRHKFNGRTIEQYLFDESIINETMKYEAIRSKGERSISNEYWIDLQKQKHFYRPKTNLKEPDKNIQKLIKNMHIAEGVEHYWQLKKNLDFFSNCTL